jgi:tetratricopeptide (TPR) repeat protein
MPEQTDYSRLLNPYDFANPVSSQQLFCGREGELKEIRYYLDQATLTSKPMNLALLGSRAAGKTSLLNMIEIEARSRGFCVARVDLNENDATSEMAFFYKLFGDVFSAACSFERRDQDGNVSYPFEGDTGRTYETYVDMTIAYEIPADKTFCPFRFPIRYARAMSSGSPEGRISDNELKHDLLVISRELGRNVVILFDECNVLAGRRVLLQMLRNLFMNLPGFMLVFTGTPELFNDTMDEVFSPIARQFKRIEVGPFQQQADTRDCVERPLKSIGITNLQEIFEEDTYRELEQMKDMALHGLTGGRPYEIQLLCHFMFKRMQLGRTSKMEISVEVLDDVLAELEKGRQIQEWPIILKIRSFSEAELKALDFLTSCDGRATFDQLWFAEYTLRKDNRWKCRQQMLDFLEVFCKSGVLQVDDGLIRFAGGDFERIYSKYYARRRNIPLPLESAPYEHFVNIGLSIPLDMTYELKGLSNALPPLHIEGEGASYVYLTISSELYNVFDVLRGFEDAERTTDVYKVYPELAEALYWLMVKANFDGRAEVTVVNLLFESPWMSRHFPFYLDLGADKRKLGELMSITRSVEERARSLGGSVKVELRDVRVLPTGALVEGVSGSGNAELRTILAFKHAGRMVDHYQGKRLPRAVSHAEILLRYEPVVSPNILNNIGYVYMATGELAKALQAFSRAADAYGGAPEAALPFYNNGVACLMLGHYEEASQYLALASELGAQRSSPENRCACLFTPCLTDGALTLVEEQQPDLLECTVRALTLVEQLRPQT